MSINEADLPTGSRRFTATVAFPQSHVTSAKTESFEFVTGPKGDPGPPGPQGEWDSMTQAEYDAIPIKDPSVLYVIVP